MIKQDSTNSRAEEYFDVIADGYNAVDTGNTPVRRYSEVYTLLNIVGDLTGKTVLDMACSDGFFTRKLKEAGADKVIGVDLSAKMIELARLHESQRPLGIEYHVSSVFDVGVLGNFDLVFTPFVMSYAQTRAELFEMCRILNANLKPGGRLISMNDNPNLLIDSETDFAKYGKMKRMTPPVADGAKITVTWVVPRDNGDEQRVAFECNYFSRETLEWALLGAGFKDIRLHHPEVSSDGLKKYGRSFWQRFLDHPLLVFIECRK